MKLRTLATIAIVLLAFGVAEAAFKDSWKKTFWFLDTEAEEGDGSAAAVENEMKQKEEVRK